MARRWLCLLISGVWALGCGPDRRECTGPHADFDVLLRLREGPLPPDTVVHVTYGGSGKEDYRVNEQGATHEVVFCQAASVDGGLEANPEAGAAGASALEDAGADAGSGVEALRCELWTGGFAKLEVHSASLSTMIYDLTPLDHVCTVKQTIVLDSPDGG